MFEAVRIIAELKPKNFIAENVKGLYSVNEGVDFYEAIRFLTYLNSDSPQYTVEMQLLNTSWFLPQNRERVYFVGHIGTRSVKRIFPIGENNSKNAGSSINIVAVLNSSQDGIVLGIDGISQTLSAGHGNVTKIQCLNSDSSQYSRIYNPKGISPALGGSSKVSGADTPKIIAQLGRYTENGIEQQIEERNDGNTNTLTGVQKDNLVIHNMLPRSSKSGLGGTGHLSKEDGTAYCLDTGNVNAIEYNDSIRRLTEVESERLQGYPDNWTEYGIYQKQVWINKKEKTFKIVEGKYKIPKTQRYKLIGNAVTTNCVKEIGKNLKQILLNN